MTGDRRQTGRWWGRGRGLPRDVFDDWSSAVAAAGGPARILAWTHIAGDTASAYAIGSPAALSTGRPGDWRHVGWHTIEHGGWNAETGRLTWREYGGRRGAVALPTPARLPELFRERVAASIVVERFLPVRGDRGIVVHGRRDLGRDDQPIAWHTSLGRGLSWSIPGLREAADRAVAELRLEYDPAQNRW